ncbi:Facilitated trehalose transporter Tret1 [Amphibalanus amphitrite]|uniref:Facilitated trehalose transporter Tret1 n=1 Tax=Amphibalanus amphitrite TaxID=1232801 RepID=A0A6A4W5F9_AMPAM|nr:Facilitated trehalose transporter Tret1 [Amphibalanus amphitrite]
MAVHHLGPRRVLLLQALPTIAGWLMQALANGFPVLFIGRCLVGACTGLSMSAGQVYRAEMSSPQIRGRLVCLGGLFDNVGAILSYVIGYLLPWRWVPAAFVIVFLMPSALGMLLVPESPYWLMGKQRPEDARRSLLTLRGDPAVADRDLAIITEACKSRQEALTPRELAKEMSKLCVLAPFLTVLARDQVPEWAGWRHISWLPLALMLFYIIAFDFGFGRTTWVVHAELLPNRVLVGVMVAMITVSTSANSAAAVMLPQLLSNASDIPITAEQGIWFASAHTLSAAVCSTMGGMAVHHLGPRRVLLLQALPTIAGWLMQALANGYPLLLVGRCLVGGVTGFSLSAGQVYLGESSSPQIRGRLVCIIGFFNNLGSIICYVVGYLLPWRWVPAAYIIVFLLPSSVGMLLVPESPYWLLGKQKHQRARRSLRRPLLMFSGIGCTLTSLGMAAFLFARDQTPEWTGWRHISWLPLPLILSYVVAFDFGFARTGWVVHAEIFPNRVRSALAGFEYEPWKDNNKKT